MRYLRAYNWILISPWWLIHWDYILNITMLILYKGCPCGVLIKVLIAVLHIRLPIRDIFLGFSNNCNEYAYSLYPLIISFWSPPRNWVIFFRLLRRSSKSFALKETAFNLKEILKLTWTLIRAQWMKRLRSEDTIYENGVSAIELLYITASQSQV